MWQCRVSSSQAWRGRPERHWRYRHAIRGWHCSSCRGNFRHVSLLVARRVWLLGCRRCVVVAVGAGIRAAAISVTDILETVLFCRLTDWLLLELDIARGQHIGVQDTRKVHRWQACKLLAEACVKMLPKQTEMSRKVVVGVAKAHRRRDYSGHSKHLRALKCRSTAMSWPAPESILSTFHSCANKYA